MAILRYRQIIEHRSPKVRTITDEFTIQNQTNDDLGFILFEFQAGMYRSNLHILDNDDSELAFYTNDWVKQYLKGTNADWAVNLLSALVDGKKAVLLVALPNDRQFGKMETRVFRLVYTDDLEPDISSHSLMSIPKFNINLRPPLEKGYRTQIVILPPDDFELNLKKDNGTVTNPQGKTSPLKDAKNYYRRRTRAVIYSLITH